MEQQELKGQVGHLDETQEKAFAEFKAKVEAEMQNEEIRRWWDDNTLLRYLRARKFEVNAAFKQFSTTCQWRKEKNIDALYENFDTQSIEDMKTLLPQWTGQTDKMGRGVYVYRVSSLDSKRTSELLGGKAEDRYDSIVALTEMLQRFTFPLLSSVPSASYPSPISSCTTITDLQGVTLKSMWNLRQHVQSASLISSAHYPETSSRIIIVNSPSFMSIIFGWISKLLEPVTVSKILILGSDPSKELLELIDPESLPKVYGGELEWKYGEKAVLDQKLKEVIGDQLPPGALAFEDGKVKLLGTGRDIY